MKNLTDRQQRFVEEYLVDPNASQAAIRAGYAKRAAKEMGYENLTKPHIISLMEKSQRERGEQLKIDAKWALTRLVDEANADLVDILESDGSIKPLHEWPEVWRRGLVVSIDIQQVVSPEGDNRCMRITELRMSDRLRKLELIGRHRDVQAFKDQLQLTTDDALTERILAGRQRARIDI